MERRPRAELIGHRRSGKLTMAIAQRVKRELAERDWTYVQEYADAKTEVVEGIIARARGGPRA